MALVILAGYLFVASGRMPVATRGEPLPLERTLARTALHAAIGKEEDLPAPFPADEKHLVSGARIYRAQCAVCHGFPGQPPSAISKGMFPKPPQLLPPEKGVTDDPVGEIHWKVKNGIRLTGMPGYESTLSETEIWEVSLFLLKADHLPPAALQAAREK